jgi:glycosyltransferase involved in cell wall biosynthesis
MLRIKGFRREDERGEIRRDRSMKKILVFIDWYEPGFKAGGPIRSCVNFAFHMKADYEIFVFTADRDLGETTAYKNIKTDEWITKEPHVHLFYASPEFLGWKNILMLIRKVNPDFIYLNSMFSKYFTVYPLLMKKFHNVHAAIILAPRGMLRSSALAYKPFKKKLFIKLFSTLNIPAIVRFEATDSTEVKDIKLQFGDEAVVHQVSNFPAVQKSFVPVREKQTGYLKMIFVGRIHPVKNLTFLLECLAHIKYMIDLTVVAAMEDQQYWAVCSGLIAKLPPNIHVDLISNLPHEELENMLLKHHLFVLPTKGENFGHAIYEALAAGRPVLISDQTPWRNLEEKMAGWDFSLEDKKPFQQVINKMAELDLEAFSAYCRQAWQFCKDTITTSDIKKENLKLFS